MHHKNERKQFCVTPKFFFLFFFGGGVGEGGYNKRLEIFILLLHGLHTHVQRCFLISEDILKLHSYANANIFTH